MIFRKKMRYILVEASGDVRMGDRRIQEELKTAMKSFLGELPYFKTNPQVATQLNNRVFVVSTNRGYERSVVLALSFIKELQDKRVGFYTIRTSGTIRSIKDAFRKLY